MRKRILLSLFCGLVGLAAVVQADAPRYRVTKITDGKQTKFIKGFAHDLNNHGDVVGELDNRAYVWRKGKFTYLTALKGSQSTTAYGINDSGQIVGKSIPEIGSEQYLLWQNGKAQNLGAVTWGIIPRINKHGQVLLGASDNKSLHAVLWQKGRRTDLGAWMPTNFNDSAQITGMKSTGSLLREGGLKKTDKIWATLWENGKATAVGPNGSGAMLINNKRDYLVVESLISTPRYYLVKAGKRIDITPSHRPEMVLNAMNDHCQLVGHAENKSHGTHAVLWQNGKWFNLNNLVPKNSGWVLNGAQNINEKGQIVGYGEHNGMPSAFLLTPIQ